MPSTRDIGNAFHKEQRLCATDTYDLRECAGTCHAPDLEDACRKTRRVRATDTHDLRGYMGAYRTQDLNVDGACRNRTSTALVATGPRSHLSKEAAPVCHQHTRFTRTRRCVSHPRSRRRAPHETAPVCHRHMTCGWCEVCITRETSQGACRKRQRLRVIDTYDLPSSMGPAAVQRPKLLTRRGANLASIYPGSETLPGRRAVNCETPARPEASPASSYPGFETPRRAVLCAAPTPRPPSWRRRARPFP